MIKKIILYCSIIIISSSCDAPRENPLDPENPDNKFSSLTGIVKTVSVPNQPIDNVNVFWDNENIVVETDNSGTFTIEDINPVPGYLYFRKDGYSPDSIQINWEERRNINVVQQLNSIPKMTSGSLTSSVENRFGDIQVYKINVNVEIVDDENDVDSVFVSNTDLEFIEPLNNISVTVFQNQFTPSTLNLSAIDDVIGREFEIIAKDAVGKEFGIAELTVKRIIKESIELLSPLDNEVVGDTLLLNWRRFTPGYPFHYLLQIYTDTVDPDLVWQKDNIPSKEIFLEAVNSVDPGEYFWVLWIVDEFGNKARSRPASFIVE